MFFKFNVSKDISIEVVRVNSWVIWQRARVTRFMITTDFQLPRFLISGARQKTLWHVGGKLSENLVSYLETFLKPAKYRANTDKIGVRVLGADLPRGILLSVSHIKPLHTRTLLLFTTTVCWLRKPTLSFEDRLPSDSVTFIYYGVATSLSTLYFEFRTLEFIPQTFLIIPIACLISKRAAVVKAARI